MGVSPALIDSGTGRDKDLETFRNNKHDFHFNIIHLALIIHHPRNRTITCLHNGGNNVFGALDLYS